MAQVVSPGFCGKHSRATYGVRSLFSTMTGLPPRLAMAGPQAGSAGSSIGGVWSAGLQALAMTKGADASDVGPMAFGRAGDRGTSGRGEATVGWGRVRVSTCAQ